MTLEGAKFICLDEAGNHGEIVLAKGRKFTMGYYVNCDYLLVDERAKGVHCEIECDAFGRVSIRNLSPDKPILVNGSSVEIKRILLHNSKLSILDKEYLWLFPRSSSNEFEDLPVEDASTPQKLISNPEQAPNSCPDFKLHRDLPKRFTVHNFAYCIQSDEEGNTSSESNDQNEETDKIQTEKETENQTLQLSTKDARDEASHKDSEKENRNRSITPEPKEEMAKSTSEGLETPKMNLINCTKDKENNSTQKKNKQLLKMCHQSDVVITSFSPRETGVKSCKSFATVLKPKVLVTKPPTTPKSVYSTPKSDMNEKGQDDSYESNMIVFHTPSTSGKGTENVSGLPTPFTKVLKNSSMHLKKNIPLTADKSVIKLSPEEQLGLTTLPISPVVTNDSTSAPLEITSSVISVNSSTDTSSIIELTSDRSNMCVTPSGITVLKTPIKTQTRTGVCTPKRTPQSLMKRAILTSAKKQNITPQQTKQITTTPRREAINRIPLRSNLALSKTPVTPQAQTGVSQLPRRQSMSTPARKSTALRRFDNSPSAISFVPASPSTSRRSSLNPISAAKVLPTSTPVSNNSSLRNNRAVCKTSPLHKVRKSLGGIPLSSHISKARKSIALSASAKITSIKEKSPQQAMSGRLVNRARKSITIIPISARTRRMVEAAKTPPKTTCPTSVLQDKTAKQSTKKPEREAVLCAEMSTEKENEADNLSRTFILDSNEDEEVKVKKDATFSPEKDSSKNLNNTETKEEVQVIETPVDAAEVIDLCSENIETTNQKNNTDNSILADPCHEDKHSTAIEKEDKLEDLLDNNVDRFKTNITEESFAEEINESAKQNNIAGASKNLETLELDLPTETKIISNETNENNATDSDNADSNTVETGFGEESKIDVSQISPSENIPHKERELREENTDSQRTLPEDERKEIEKVLVTKVDEETESPVEDAVDENKIQTKDEAQKLNEYKPIVEDITLEGSLIEKETKDNDDNILNKSLLSENINLECSITEEKVKSEKIKKENKTAIEEIADTKQVCESSKDIEISVQSETMKQINVAVANNLPTTEEISPNNQEKEEIFVDESESKLEESLINQNKTKVLDTNQYTKNVEVNNETTKTPQQQKEMQNEIFNSIETQDNDSGSKNIQASQQEQSKIMQTNKEDTETLCTADIERKVEENLEETNKLLEEIEDVLNKSDEIKQKQLNELEQISDKPLTEEYEIEQASQEKSEPEKETEIIFQSSGEQHDHAVDESTLASDNIPSCTQEKLEIEIEKEIEVVVQSDNSEYTEMDKEINENEQELDPLKTLNKENIAGKSITVNKNQESAELKISFDTESGNSESTIQHENTVEEVSKPNERSVESVQNEEHIQQKDDVIEHQKVQNITEKNETPNMVKELHTDSSHQVKPINKKIENVLTFTPRRSTRRTSQSTETPEAVSELTLTPRRSTRRSSMSADSSTTLLTPTRRSTRRASLSAVNDLPTTPKSITKRRVSISVENETVKPSSSKIQQRAKTPRKRLEQTMVIPEESDEICDVISEDKEEPVQDKAQLVSKEMTPPRRVDDEVLTETLKQVEAKTEQHMACQEEEDVSAAIIVEKEPTCKKDSSEQKNSKELVEISFSIASNKEMKFNLEKDTPVSISNENVLNEEIKDDNLTLEEKPNEEFPEISSTSKTDKEQNDEVEESLTTQEDVVDKNSSFTKETSQGNEKHITVLLKDTAEEIEKSEEKSTEDYIEIPSTSEIDTEKTDDVEENSTTLENINENNTLSTKESSQIVENETLDVISNKDDLSMENLTLEEEQSEERDNIEVIEEDVSSKDQNETVTENLETSIGQENVKGNHENLKHEVTEEVEESLAHHTEADQETIKDEPEKTKCDDSVNTKSSECHENKEITDSSKASSSIDKPTDAILISTPIKIVADSSSAETCTHPLGDSKDLVRTPCMAVEELTLTQKISKPEVSTPKTTKNIKATIDSLKTPLMSGVRELLKTPKPETQTPIFEGIRNLVQTPEKTEEDEMEKLAVSSDFLTEISTPKIKKQVTIIAESSKTPLMTGLRELLKTPKPEVNTPKLTGIRELIKTPVTSSENEQEETVKLAMLTELVKTPKCSRNNEELPTSTMKGVKELLQTPKNVRTPQLKGIRELVKTPKITETPCTTGVKELFEYSAIQTSESVQISNVEIKEDATSLPEDLPLTTSPNLPNLKGVKELLQTPKRCSTPRLKGLRELMQTPKMSSTPILSGIKELMDDSSVQQDDQELEKFLRTPTAKNIMIPSMPSSAVIEKSSESIEISTEYDLNATHEGDTTNLEELFKTPVVSRFVERITGSYYGEERAEEEEGRNEYLNKPQSDETLQDELNKSAEEAFDKLIGQESQIKTPVSKRYARKSFTLQTPQCASPFTAAEVLSDLPRTDVEEWIETLDQADQPSIIECEDIGEDNAEEKVLNEDVEKTLKDTDEVSSTDYSLNRDEQNTSLNESVIPETCAKIFIQEKKPQTKSPSFLTCTDTKDPLLYTDTKYKEKEILSLVTPNVAEISGINLLDQTLESLQDEPSMLDEPLFVEEPSIFDEPLIVSDNESEDEKSLNVTENTNVSQDEGNDLSEPLLLSDSEDLNLSQKSEPIEKVEAENEMGDINDQEKSMLEKLPSENGASTEDPLETIDTSVLLIEEQNTIVEVDISQNEAECLDIATAEAEVLNKEETGTVSSDEKQKSRVETDLAMESNEVNVLEINHHIKQDSCEIANVLEISSTTPADDSEFNLKKESIRAEQNEENSVTEPEEPEDVYKSQLENIQAEQIAFVTLSDTAKEVVTEQMKAVSIEDADVIEGDTSVEPDDVDKSQFKNIEAKEIAAGALFDPAKEVAIEQTKVISIESADLIVDDTSVEPEDIDKSQFKNSEAKEIVAGPHSDSAKEVVMEQTKVVSIESVDVIVDNTSVEPEDVDKSQFKNLEGQEIIGGTLSDSAKEVVIEQTKVVSADVIVDDTLVEPEDIDKSQFKNLEAKEIAAGPLSDLAKEVVIEQTKVVSIESADEIVDDTSLEPEDVDNSLFKNLEAKEIAAGPLSDSAKEVVVEQTNVVSIESADVIIDDTSVEPEDVDKCQFENKEDKKIAVGTLSDLSKEVAIEQTKAVSIESADVVVDTSVSEICEETNILNEDNIELSEKPQKSFKKAAELECQDIFMDNSNIDEAFADEANDEETNDALSKTDTKTSIIDDDADIKNETAIVSGSALCNQTAEDKENKENVDHLSIERKETLDTDQSIQALEGSTNSEIEQVISDEKSVESSSTRTSATEIKLEYEPLLVEDLEHEQFEMQTSETSEVDKVILEETSVESTPKATFISEENVVPLSEESENVDKEEIESEAGATMPKQQVHKDILNATEKLPTMERVELEINQATEILLENEENLQSSSGVVIENEENKTSDVTPGASEKSVLCKSQTLEKSSIVIPQKVIEEKISEPNIVTEDSTPNDENLESSSGIISEVEQNKSSIDTIEVIENSLLETKEICNTQTVAEVSTTFQLKGSVSTHDVTKEIVSEPSEESQQLQIETNVIKAKKDVTIEDKKSSETAATKSSDIKEEQNIDININPEIEENLDTKSTEENVETSADNLATTPNKGGTCKKTENQIECDNKKDIDENYMSTDQNETSGVSVAAEEISSIKNTEIGIESSVSPKSIQQVSLVEEQAISNTEVIKSLAKSMKDLDSETVKYDFEIKISDRDNFDELATTSSQPEFSQTITEIKSHTDEQPLKEDNTQITEKAENQPEERQNLAKDLKETEQRDTSAIKTERRKRTASESSQESAQEETKTSFRKDRRKVIKNPPKGHLEEIKEDVKVHAKNIIFGEDKEDEKAKRKRTTSESSQGSVKDNDTGCTKPRRGGRRKKSKISQDAIEEEDKVEGEVGISQLEKKEYEVADQVKTSPINKENVTAPEEPMLTEEIQQQVETEESKLDLVEPREVAGMDTLHEIQNPQDFEFIATIEETTTIEEIQTDKQAISKEVINEIGRQKESVNTSAKELIILTDSPASTSKINEGAVTEKHADKKLSASFEEHSNTELVQESTDSKYEETKTEKHDDTTQDKKLFAASSKTPSDILQKQEIVKNVVESPITPHETLPKELLPSDQKLENDAGTQRSSKIEDSEQKIDAMVERTEQLISKRSRRKQLISQSSQGSVHEDENKLSKTTRRKVQKTSADKTVFEDETQEDEDIFAAANIEKISNEPEPSHCEDRIDEARSITPKTDDLSNKRGRRKQTVSESSQDSHQGDVNTRAKRTRRKVQKTLVEDAVTEESQEDVKFPSETATKTIEIATDEGENISKLSLKTKHIDSDENFQKDETHDIKLEIEVESERQTEPSTSKSSQGLAHDNKEPISVDNEKSPLQASNTNEILVEPKEIINESTQYHDEELTDETPTIPLDVEEPKHKRTRRKPTISESSQENETSRTRRFGRKVQKTFPEENMEEKERKEENQRVPSDLNKEEQTAVQNVEKFAINEAATEVSKMQSEEAETDEANKHKSQTKEEHLANVKETPSKQEESPERSSKRGRNKTTLQEPALEEPTTSRRTRRKAHVSSAEVAITESENKKLQVVAEQEEDVANVESIKESNDGKMSSKVDSPTKKTEKRGKHHKTGENVLSEEDMISINNENLTKTHKQEGKEFDAKSPEKTQVEVQKLQEDLVKQGQSEKETSTKQATKRGRPRKVDSATLPVTRRGGRHNIETPEATASPLVHKGRTVNRNRKTPVEHITGDLEEEQISTDSKNVNEVPEAQQKTPSKCVLPAKSVGKKENAKNIGLEVDAKEEMKPAKEQDSPNLEEHKKEEENLLKKPEKPTSPPSVSNEPGKPSSQKEENKNVPIEKEKQAETEQDVSVKVQKSTRRKAVVNTEQHDKQNQELSTRSRRKRGAGEDDKAMQHHSNDSMELKNSTESTQLSEVEITKENLKPDETLDKTKTSFEENQEVNVKKGRKEIAEESHSEEHEEPVVSTKRKAAEKQTHDEILSSVKKRVGRRKQVMEERKTEEEHVALEERNKQSNVHKSTSTMEQNEDKPEKKEKSETDEEEKHTRTSSRRRNIGKKTPDYREDDEKQLTEQTKKCDETTDIEKKQNIHDDEHDQEETKRGRIRRKKDEQKEDSKPPSTTQTPETKTRGRKRKESSNDTRDNASKEDVPSDNTEEQQETPTSSASTTKKALKIFEHITAESQETEDTPSRKARNVPQRRAATAYHNYDETSDSEVTTKTKKKTDSPRKSLEAIKKSPSAAITPAPIVGVSPSPSSTPSITTARGRTRKPTARVQQYLEEERAKADTPKKRALLAAAANVGTTTPQGTPAKRGRKASANEEEVTPQVSKVRGRGKVNQESTDLPTIIKITTVVEEKDVEKQSTLTTKCSSNTRKGGRKAKLTEEESHSADEPPAKKSSQETESEKQESSPSEPPTPTRTAGRRNAAAAAKARIEEDALAAAAIEPPKKSRTKKATQKVSTQLIPSTDTDNHSTTETEEEQSSKVGKETKNKNTSSKKRDHRLASASTVEGADDLQDDEVDKSEKISHKRGVKSATISTTDSPAVPAKRGRKPKIVEEVTHPKTPVDSSTASTRGRGRGRKNVHFDEQEAEASSSQQNENDTHSTPVDTPEPVKRGTRTKRK